MIIKIINQNLSENCLKIIFTYFLVSLKINIEIIDEKFN